MPEEPAYPDQEAFADSAYVGEKIDTELQKRGYIPMICEKGYRNKPLKVGWSAFIGQETVLNKVKNVAAIFLRLTVNNRPDKIPSPVKQKQALLRNNLPGITGATKQSLRLNVLIGH